MIEEWFSYSQMTFTRRQVCWVLENAAWFLRGKWPPQPLTHYFDQPVTSLRYKTEASYVKPVIVWAEITERAKQCGRDGADCVDYYTAKGNDAGDVILRTLCRHRQQNEDLVLYHLRRVVNYIASGGCRRWITCPAQCKDAAKCKHPHRKPVAYKGMK